MHANLRRAAFAVIVLTGAGLSTTAYAACGADQIADPPARARHNQRAIDNLLRDAGTALASGDLGEACSKYRLVLSVDRNNAAARLGLGEGALSELNYSAARTHFEAVGATNAIAAQGIGLSYLLAGDMTAAEPYLRQSVTADPTLWRAWNGLGVISDTRGNWVEADSAWTSAIMVAPDRAQLHSNRGLSLMQRGEPAQALEAFETALRLDSNLTAAINNRRIALAMTGQYDAALAGVSERDLPAALNNVAVVAARRGDRAIADRLLSAAITASPRYYELAMRNREVLTSAN